jgi:hypothetical protein
MTSDQLSSAIYNDGKPKVANGMSERLLTVSYVGLLFFFIMLCECVYRSCYYMLLNMLSGCSTASLVVFIAAPIDMIDLLEQYVIAISSDVTTTELT